MDFLNESGVRDIEAEHRKRFKIWFEKKVITQYQCNFLINAQVLINAFFRNQIFDMKASGSDVSDELYSLSIGSLQVAYQYPSCFVNGVKFITRRRDNQRVTQNSGVCVLVDDFTYYGRMEDVIVVNYRHNCSVVLFKCIWYGDKYHANRLVHTDKTTGETSAYTAKQWFKEEPYVLATQVKQVFYIEDLVKGGDWEIVQECNHRGIWDIPEVDPSNSASIPLTIELSNIERLNHRHEIDEAELVTVVDDDEEDDDENERQVVFEGEDVDVDIEDDINIIGIDDDE